MKIIIDTSFFTNPDSYKYWGKSVSEAIINFVDLVNKQKEYSFYMPTTAFEELKTFFDNQPHQVLKALEGSITIQSPYVDNLQLPLRFFYDLVLEIRQRSYKGLRIAEDLIRNPNSQPEESIKKLRKQYRHALRAGFLDSQADLDVLFLTYQLNGRLTTTDEGIKKWANKIGLSLLSSAGLKKLLTK